MRAAQGKAFSDQLLWDPYNWSVIFEP